MDDEPWKTVHDNNLGEMLRKLLENYEPIATPQYMILVPTGSMFRDFRENIDAAVKASLLGLSSVDYVKRQYGLQPNEVSIQDGNTEAYTRAYYLAKNYVLGAISRLTTEGKPLPKAGVFGASLVLERLPASFFSAHLLYRLGNGYEGHAVARLILEQIAWAYAACKYGNKDLEKVQKLSATRAVRELKALSPSAEPLYGFLSDKTHLSYNNHFEFLSVKDGKNAIRRNQYRMDEYAKVVLQLADLFVVVWEFSQSDYLEEFVALKKTRLGYQPKKTREFLKASRAMIKAVKAATTSQYNEAD